MGLFDLFIFLVLDIINLEFFQISFSCLATICIFNIIRRLMFL